MDEPRPLKILRLRAEIGELGGAIRLLRRSGMVSAKRPAVGRCLRSLATRQAGSHQPKDQARRRDPLRSLALAMISEPTAKRPATKRTIPLSLSKKPFVTDFHKRLDFPRYRSRDSTLVGSKPGPFLLMGRTIRGIIRVVMPRRISGFCSVQTNKQTPKSVRFIRGL